MKIVVIGGSGLIGKKVVNDLRQRGHEVVAASPSSGVNALTGEGLARVFAGAAVVVNVSNSPSFADATVLAFFETSTRNLLAAERDAGVGHHVALSVVGADRLPESGYMRAKVGQEGLIEAGHVPYTIVRATQFFEFVGGIAQSATEGNAVRVPPALMQPILSDDVAFALAEIAVGEPLIDTVELAGPEPIRQDELVRQFLLANRDAREVITDVHARYFGTELNDQSLTPGGKSSPWPNAVCGLAHPLHTSAIERKNKRRKRDRSECHGLKHLTLIKQMGCDEARTHWVCLYVQLVGFYQLRTGDTSMQSQRRLLSVLGRIRANVTTHLDETTINAACRAENYSWRNRRFNPTNTIHTFITQVLHCNTALTDLPRVTGETFCGSAFGKARKRLPLAVFQRLLRWLSAALIPKSKADGDESDGRWRGHRVFMMDGSSASMPDTPELQQHFGQPGGQLPGCGFPVAHLTYLFHAGTGLIREVLAAPLRTHDMSQAIQLHPAFEPGDVGVGDRGFCSYAHLALLSLRQAFGVFRLHQRKKTDFEIHRLVRDETTEKTRRLPRWLSQLGAMDQLVEWVKPKKPPAWMSAAQYAQLPERLVVRELRYLVGKKGFRTKEVTLVTTLLDAELYPLEALAELYRQRWQVEQHLRESKQTMEMDVLKCKTVDGVLKELTIYAIVYNLVRVVLQAAASLQKQPLFRLSFIDALRWLRSAKEGSKLSKIKVNPYRPNRVEPRVVKRRPKQYRRMTAPRSVLRQRLLEGSVAA